MRTSLIVLCVILAIPALLIGATGSPPDKPLLIPGAILLGSATIAAAMPKQAADRKPRGLD